uniref:DUF5672 domain-containing protein n=1 Tax=viral metagenome TaxID=1070528 RepID=A0A6C0JFE9_9ZZZZ
MFKYTAIIVEPRKHKALEFVLNNVCDCLSDEWRIILFHGKNNNEYANEIVEKLNSLYKNRISLVNLYVDNLNQETYSHLLANKNTIYQHIETEIFLVFQTDSIILKENSHMINEYLNYDYVGSPWLRSNYQPTKNCDFIGNGGFSLRNKKKMLEIIEKIPYNNEYEDLYFSTNYNNILVNKPSYEKALCFCVGEVYNNQTTLAVHQFWPWDYKIKDNPNHYYHTLMKKYSDCKNLLSLQDSF